MQLELLSNYKFNLLFRLYLLGRQVVFKSRLKNTDQMLKAVTLALLTQQNLTISQLANQIGTTLSTISEKVKALETENLIKKIKADDPRQTLVQVTSQGKKYINSFTKKLPTTGIDQAVNLTRKESDLFLALLNKIKI